MVVGVTPVPDFETFVHSRGARLLRLGYLLCGDPTQAEDLIQTALAIAHRKWHRVSEATDVDAYVRQIVVNEHLSTRRRKASGERVLAEVPDRGTPSGTDAVDARDAAWRALARLPRQQRAVLVLRYYEDLDDSRIAQLLGCSPGTVRGYAWRALAVLREDSSLVAAFPSMTRGRE
jgi:RNA polymerase sigma-70 factor (sigma-E family)